MFLTVFYYHGLDLFITFMTIANENISHYINILYASTLRTFPLLLWLIGFITVFFLNLTTLINVNLIF